MLETEFRLPLEVVNQQFQKVGWPVVIGLLVSNFFIHGGELASLASTAILIGCIFGAVYFVARRHVWVTLSATGVSGTGYTGRRVCVLWSDAISVAPTIKSGISGIEVRASQNDGFLRSKVLSLFIPEPILFGSSFRLSLHQLAPPDHPLHAYTARL